MSIDVFFFSALFHNSTENSCEILTKKTTTELWNYNDSDVFDANEMEDRESRNIISVDPDGSIYFDERNFSSMSKKEQQNIRKEIGMVFQGGALFDSKTIEENLMVPLIMFSSI